MNESYFILNNKRYYVGTIIKIKKDKKKMFNYSSMLNFYGYDSKENVYCFTDIYDMLAVYRLSHEQISECVDNVLSEKLIPKNTQKKLEIKYINGIVECCTWYVLIMFGAIFIKGFENVLVTWIAATIIFFTWINNKVNRK